MNNKPIGVFDSGLGGLTAVKEIMRVLPYEDIIYFGDTGRVPYGNRSRETIIRYTKDDIDFLLKHNIKVIIAACGTASSVALGQLYDKYDIKIIGVLEPACEEAVKITKNGRIGVIGTTGTIKSGKYTFEQSAITDTKVPIDFTEATGTTFFFRNANGKDMEKYLKIIKKTLTFGTNYSIFEPM